MIPKPDGSQRELGIPTVLDRLIQQALLQVLQPLIDPTFSEHSHGFRPARRAHDAVQAARVQRLRYFGSEPSQLRHWKRPATMYRERKALGAGDTVARRVAANSRRWWRNSARLLKTVLTIAYFDRLGVPRLA